MLGFQKNDRYTSIAIYAFCVLALLILLAVLGINMPHIYRQINYLLTALRPVTIGLIIAYIANPLVRFSERRILPRLKSKSRRVARILAIALTYFFMVTVLGILILMIVPQIVFNYQDFYANIEGYLTSLWSTVDEWIRNSAWLGDYEGLSDFFNKQDIGASLNNWLGVIAGYLAGISARLIALTGTTLIALFLSVYFLYRKEAIGAFLKKASLALFPRRFSDRAAELVSFADRAFGQFIVGNLFDSLIVGLIAFVALALFNIPYYPLISAILCITNIIPAFGPFIGMIPSFFIILISDPAKAFWFLLIALAIQQVNGNFISPRIIGSATGLSAVWVITAIILMGAYLGPIGWFIGVPVFSVLYRVLGDFVNRRLKKKSYPTASEAYDRPLDEIESAHMIFPETEEDEPFHAVEEVDEP